MITGNTKQGSPKQVGGHIHSFDVMGKKEFGDKEGIKNLDI